VRNKEILFVVYQVLPYLAKVKLMTALKTSSTILRKRSGELMICKQQLAILGIAILTFALGTTVLVIWISDPDAMQSALQELHKVLRLFLPNI